MLLSRPSGDFQPFESAALPPVPPMQVAPLAPIALPASTAGIAPTSNFDLLGDLDVSQPSMPVQPNSFASPPAAAQSTTLAMTVLTSGGVMGAEAAMAFTPVLPYALTAAASVPGTAPNATSVESVCMNVDCLC